MMKIILTLIVSLVTSTAVFAMKLAEKPCNCHKAVKKDHNRHIWEGSNYRSHDVSGPSMHEERD